MSAMVNGFGPFRLLLDTGSSHSAVSQRLAQSAGTRVVGRAPIVSTVGNELRSVVHIERLQLTGFTAPDVFASVVGTETIDPADGLIGQDVLASRRYTLDFASRCVFWHDRPVAPSRGTLTFNLHLERGRFLVELPQREGRLRLVPDSAAQGLVLFDRGGPLPVPFEYVPGYVELATIAGRMKVRQMRVRELRLGASALRDVPGVLVDRHHADRSEGDGLLPLDLFDRVTVDGPGRRLIVRERASVP